MIWENQSAYYKAIEESTENTDSEIFVDFMLEVILNAIKSRNDPVNDPVNQVLEIIKRTPNLSYNQIAIKIGKSPATVKRALSKLKESNRIKRIGSDKNGHWEVCK